MPVRLLGRAMLAVLAVVGLPQVAHADFINLVSQNYQIDAVAFGCCPTVPPVNETSTTPISFDKDGMFFNAMGQPIGGFTVFTSASGGITPLSGFVQAQTNAYDVLQAGPTNADASAMITFRPLVTDLVVRPTDPWSPNGPGCPRPVRKLGRRGHECRAIG
jgi:hypothetical protein